MSLPNYLAKIKSSGMYRFTFDKSQVPPAAAETMRLVVGYSEKGPFNNPVYIDNKQDFINLFGNINKRLEKRGVFFHRMALQALSAGPILALNLKPFDGEDVEYLSFNPSEITASVNPTAADISVKDLLDTDRFWKLDGDKLPEKIKTAQGGTAAKYINIAATDTIAQSCSLFIRNCNDDDLKQYDVTVADWYKSLGEDVPEYLEGYEKVSIKNFFAEIYAFRGLFDTTLVDNDNLPLSKYLSTDADGKKVVLKTDYTNAFGESADALAALAADENSNFVGRYMGCVLPYFKDLLGNYISLDIVFNADKNTHKMIMKLDDAVIDDVLDGKDNAIVNLPLISNGWVVSENVVVNNAALSPIYLKGYSYTTLTKTSTAKDIYDDCFGVLKNKGIYTALTNHVDSEYHYIVDTFDTLVAGGTIGEKAMLVDIAKTKDNCLAILNWPSMESIQSHLKTSDVEFKDIHKAISLPSEVNGASFCAFYTPLVFGDGALKYNVPSAALVSNNFMEKWTSRQPYYIVAGPNYGRMDYEGLVGPDYNYGRDDLNIYEPFGINCMVFAPRKGTYINSNQTAKQKPVSALSKVHVRELVIYLQNEIETMMQNYQWEMNTQTLRDTIKTKADTILERVKNNGGVYEYLNVCDGSNNTAEVIDNEMIILDTSIEPARGAGKMVQRLTIHKTGGISALSA